MTRAWPGETGKRSKIAKASALEAIQSDSGMARKGESMEGATDGSESYASHRPLHELHRELGSAMSRVGLSVPDTGSFSPHMTFLYGDPIAGSRTVTPVRWTPREFVLIHSLVGLTEHRVLGRWPLVGWW